MNAKCQIPDWVSQLFKGLDKKSVSIFSSFLTDDCVFRYGSLPAVEGKDAIQDFVGGFLGNIQKTEHTISRFVETQQSMFIEGECAYLTRSGAKVTLPFLNVFEIQAGLISKYFVYIDPSPLIAAM